jgi:excisionase family DNA binding protein
MAWTATRGPAARGLSCEEDAGVTAAARLEELVGPLLAEAILEALREELAAAAPASEARRWLPVRDAATYLGTTERAVYQRIRRGRIPAGAVRHSGRTVLVDRQALDRALDRSA